MRFFLCPPRAPPPRRGRPSRVRKARRARGPGPGLRDTKDPVSGSGKPGDPSTPAGLASHPSDGQREGRPEEREGRRKQGREEDKAWSEGVGGRIQGLRKGSSERPEEVFFFFFFWKSFSPISQVFLDYFSGKVINVLPKYATARDSRRLAAHLPLRPAKTRLSCQISICLRAHRFLFFFFFQKKRGHFTETKEETILLPILQPGPSSSPSTPLCPFVRLRLPFHLRPTPRPWPASHPTAARKWLHVDSPHPPDGRLAALPNPHFSPLPPSPVLSPGPLDHNKNTTPLTGPSRPFRPPRPLAPLLTAPGWPRDLNSR